MSTQIRLLVFACFVMFCLVHQTLQLRPLQLLVLALFVNVQNMKRNLLMQLRTLLILEMLRGEEGLQQLKVILQLQQHQHLLLKIVEFGVLVMKVFFG
ncbi:unnamed protein product [Meloidogyne enterolobii]|uniref:Uncharacterized protein n=1 Tax=Meloidogyne enterolobii TaxID=390850 RepID=A0ACB0YRT7_MELEN